MGIRAWIHRLTGAHEPPAGGRPRAELTAMGLDEMLRHISQGLGGTASGAVVTPDSAMRVVAVFAAVRVISEALAQVPLITYRRTGEARKRATDHWLYSLLHDAPNQWQTSFEWREMMQAHVSLRGNAFSFKVRVRDETRELLPLHPDRVVVRQHDDWRLTYTISLPDGTRAEVPAADILHIRGFSQNGFTGVSPIRLAREALGLAIETERHGAQLFGNAARPGGVLTTEQKLDDKQVKQLTESWHDAMTGKNRLKTAILDAGVSYQQIALSNEDAQFLETRKFQRNEIATLFRLPPHMIGDLERATFSNIEQQALEFVVYSMGPHYKRWEQAISMQLLSRGERAEIFAEFLVDGLLRGDSKSRHQAHSLALRDGWRNVNEVRGIENLNPIEGGDIYRAAVNVYGEAGLERRETPDEPEENPDT